MRRFLTIRRARKSVDRTLNMFDLSRWWVLRGNLCEAGRCRMLAERIGVFALEDLAAVERYLPQEAQP